MFWSFPDGSVVGNLPANTGNAGSIARLERSPGEGNAFRASLIAQLVKNLPAMQETLVRFLGQEDLLEKG